MKRNLSVKNVLIGGMQKVLLTGNSLAVVIPSRFVKLLGIKKGDEVKLLTKPEAGKIVIIFSSSKQIPLKFDPKQ